VRNSNHDGAAADGIQDEDASEILQKRTNDASGVIAVVVLCLEKRANRRYSQGLLSRQDRAHDPTVQRLEVPIVGGRRKRDVQCLRIQLVEIDLRRRGCLDATQNTRDHLAGSNPIVEQRRQEPGPLKQPTGPGRKPTGISFDLRRQPGALQAHHLADPLQFVLQKPLNVAVVLADADVHRDLQRLQSFEVAAYIVPRATGEENLGGGR
jgi:hypothetical protein